MAFVFKEVKQFKTFNVDRLSARFYDGLLSLLWQNMGKKEAGRSRGIHAQQPQPRVPVLNSSLPISMNNRGAYGMQCKGVRALIGVDY